MRDPARIEPLLAELRAWWYTHPDIRFGQMVSNLAASVGQDDAFYIEDETMLTTLRMLNRNHTGKYPNE